MTLQTQAPDGLICPALDIYDAPAVTAALEAAIADADGDRFARRATVEILKAAQVRGRAAIAEGLRQQPKNATDVTASYCWLTDQLVKAAIWVATDHLHRLPNPTDGERLCVLAVGGYGRAEMAPQSDVDLLFLTPYKMTPWAESVIESTLYMLWDLKMKVGHASRTVKDCLRLAREDFTIRTSLVEYRYLTGDAPLAKTLGDRLWKELFKDTASEFIEAKLEERAERHRKQGGQRYVVEPNIKEGKGGLRDLQSLYWIGKYIHGVRHASELVKHKVFTADEYETFREAHNFLWAARCHLHLIAGRAVEQSICKSKWPIAWATPTTAGGAASSISCKTISATQPALKRRKKAKAPYAIAQNRLTVADKKAFLKDPINLINIFDEALRTGTLIHPDALRLVAANLDKIDKDLQENPDANRIFMNTMIKHGNPERALRRMNEMGVLGAFIPEFAPIVAMMQFNMYHHYTVDEHTIQCISNLAQIEREELIEELPIASGILKRGVNRKVIYAALLLHDIGKGRPEDHSVLGAQIARKVAPRLGLNKKECETVEWLIRYHLLMSDTAQKRDIAEPRTVRGFANAVKTVERLDLLTVLTVCDIRGVGPDTWNNWKAVLIRNLHSATKNVLENGLEDLNRNAREAEAKKALRAALPDWTPKEIKAELSRHYGPYWQGLPTAAHAVFADLLRDFDDTGFKFDLKPDEDRDATRACFAMVDHPGLFSRMTGALALVGANIVDARTYTSKDGYATAVFWVQDAEGSPYEAARLPRLHDMIAKTLRGDVVARDALKDRDKIKKRERAFKVPTNITFDNEGSEIYTIIEVDTRDRPGILFDLTSTLARNNVYIASAVIATYGEQVVDTFYVKDMTGVKYYAEHKRQALEKKLREAIALGVERATA